MFQRLISEDIQTHPSKCAIPERIQTWRGESGRLRTYFFEKKPWNFRICHFTLGNLRESKNFTIGYSTKLCGTPRKFQEKKPRLMEIPYDFFLMTDGNSTYFLIDPWNFNMLFL